MEFGRLVTSTDGEAYTLIRHNWITKIFVIGDVISFFFQGGGELDTNTLCRVAASANTCNRRRLPSIRHAGSARHGIEHYHHRPLRPTRLLRLLHGRRWHLPLEADPSSNNPVALPSVLPLAETLVHDVRSEPADYGAIHLQGG